MLPLIDYIRIGKKKEWKITPEETLYFHEVIGWAPEIRLGYGKRQDPSISEMIGTVGDIHEVIIYENGVLTTRRLHKVEENSYWENKWKVEEGCPLQVLTTYEKLFEEQEKVMREELSARHHEAMRAYLAKLCTIRLELVEIGTREPALVKAPYPHVVKIAFDEYRRMFGK